MPDLVLAGLLKVGVMREISNTELLDQVKVYAFDESLSPDDVLRLIRELLYWRYF